MTRYITGRTYEYRSIELLKQKGYAVIRSAGSHGPWDLVAFRGDEVLFVQVKAVVGSIVGPTETKPRVKKSETLNVDIVGYTSPGKKMSRADLLDLRGERLRSQMPVTRWLTRADWEKIVEFDDVYPGGKRQIWVWAAYGVKAKGRQLIIYDIPSGYARYILTQEDRIRKYEEMVKRLEAREVKVEAGSEVGGSSIGREAAAESTS